MGGGQQIVTCTAIESPLVLTTDSGKSPLLELLCPSLKTLLPITIAAAPAAKVISTSGEILIAPATTVPPPAEGVVKVRTYPPAFQPFPEASDGAKVFHRVEPVDAGLSRGLEVQIQGYKERVIVPENYLRKHYPKAVEGYYRRIWLPETPRDITWAVLAGRRKV